MAILIGICIGLVLGLTGAGGSIFAVPLLMAGLQWPITQAATAALLAVAVSAAVGAGLAWRHSYVRYRAATLMALIGMLFAPAGIAAADYLPEFVLKLLFAGVLVIVGMRMYRMAQRSKEDASVVRAAVAGEGHPSIGKIGHINPQTGRLIWSAPVAIAVSVIGAVTGFLSGLLGVGGGFVIVPAIRASLPLSMHSAVATSLMAIAITSLGTFTLGVLQGRHVPWALALPFVIGAVLGMVIGRRLAPAISGPSLQKAFALAAFLVSAVMVAQATANLL